MLHASDAEQPASRRPVSNCVDDAGFDSRVEASVVAAISAEVAVDGSDKDVAGEERTVIDPFPSGGQMRNLIFDHDWTGTELGPMSDWPLRLRFALGTCLESRHPIIVFWGEDLLVFYNDAYAPSMGDKHPSALGQPARECWAEIWPTIGSMLEGVLHTGNPTWADDLELGLLRHGFIEETYWTFSYSPIRDAQGVVRGVFCAVTETTDTITATRREALLRDVAVAATTARTERGFLAAVSKALRSNPNDVPFARLFSVAPESGRLRTVLATDQLGQDPFTRLHGRRGTSVEPPEDSMLAAVLATRVADAWFDLVTAPVGWDLAQSIAMSVLVELPVAGLCFWLGVHSRDVADRRIVLLTRRRRDKSGTDHGE